MPNTTQSPKATERSRATLELLFAASAAVASMAGMAYFLFAPRMAIGTASSLCTVQGSDSPTLPICDTSPPSTIVHQSLVETTFSLGWIIFFALLTLITISIPVLATLHVRTHASLWRWALIAVAILVLVLSAPLGDSLLYNSPLAIFQGGLSLIPGILFGLLAALMALLDRQRPSTQPGSDLAIQA